jgi:hypothetical protein
MTPPKLGIPDGHPTMRRRPPVARPSLPLDARPTPRALNLVVESEINPGADDRTEARAYAHGALT